MCKQLSTFVYQQPIFPLKLASSEYGCAIMHSASYPSKKKEYVGVNITNKEFRLEIEKILSSQLKVNDTVNTVTVILHLR